MLIIAPIRQLSTSALIPVVRLSCYKWRHWELHRLRLQSDGVKAFMPILYINPNDFSCTASLVSYFGDSAPDSLSALGNLDILKQNKLAIFCSAACPAELMTDAQQVIQTGLPSNMAVISGFHSPVERECLNILLSRNQPIIICPARSLAKMRIRTEYKKPLDEGRLLFLSFFRSHRHRSDIAMALSRNRFVAALADRILVVYAAPASKTETFYRELLPWRKPLFTLPNDLNEKLVALGAKPLNSQELTNWSHG
ncbi:MAG TPA: DNA-processing protein DprA [Candidatus Binatia bacterium]